MFYKSINLKQKHYEIFKTLQKHKRNMCIAKKSEKIQLIYWSLPVLFVVVWLFLTNLPACLYDLLSESIQMEYAERAKIVILSPAFLVPTVFAMYILLYIEKKCIKHPRILVIINVVLFIGAIGQSLCCLFYAENDDWHYYLAFEYALKYMPFVIVSSAMLVQMRKTKNRD